MKRLVVCCDGTWQRLYGGNLTNVALTARSIAPRDADGNPQIVFYSAGVGVSLDRLSIWEGMIGGDLDEHLLSAYTFLTLNYEPGDQIYLFGFSRGAYTVRSLAGLLRKIGILRRASADKAREALQIYRNTKISSASDAVARFRHAHACAWPRLEPSGMQRVRDEIGAPAFDLRIRYMGVWDTVGALGIPRILPFHLSFVNRRYQFHDTALSRAVQCARHAVAIDEKRRSFAPTLWSNVEDFNPPHQKPRVLQAWFPGDHGAVGGGGKDRALSNCSFLWVTEGAEDAGLRFSREPGSVMSSALAEIDPINGTLAGNPGRISVTSLLGIGWRKGLKRFEEVHETAVIRWHGDARYRPVPLRRFASHLADALQLERRAS